MSEEYKREIDLEIERISHIPDKFKQQEEFSKLFHSSFWKYAADDMFDSFLVPQQI